MTQCQPRIAPLPSLVPNGESAPNRRSVPDRAVPRAWYVTVGLVPVGAESSSGSLACGFVRAARMV
jgi:hypothetical protein